MQWYYQTTPGDNWDYTAVQDMVLADLEVDGVERKVLMQAPKNGFFYVLDRADGKQLRAHPYNAVTWATHVDLETGRPFEAPAQDYIEKPHWVLPGPLGGHIPEKIDRSIPELELTDASPADVRRGEQL